MSDGADKRRKRLRYRCQHTGMKENNLLLGAFVDRYLESMSDEDVAWLESLLMNSNDLDIYDWLTGKRPAPPELNHPVMKMLQNFQYTP